MAHFRTHFEILTYVYYTVRRVVYTGTSYVITIALFPVLLHTVQYGTESWAVDWEQAYSY